MHKHLAQPVRKASDNTVVEEETGVDKAVLQCGDVYGKLNEYYYLVLQEHPELAERFLPLVRLDESQAYSEGQLKRLEILVKEHGLKGLWFSLSEKHLTLKGLVGNTNEVYTVICPARRYIHPI